MRFWIFKISLIGFLLTASFAHAATYISDTITSDTTWTETGSPYVVSGVSVASGTTLTIEPGVVVKMSNVAVRFEVSGTLIANGTPDKKIYFTSILDDEAGGDTNGDGSATAPAPGNWVHIVFNAGSTGRITNAVIRYAGSWYTWPAKYTAIYNLGGDVQISAVEIYKNLAYGIRQDSGTTTVNFSDFHDQSIGVKQEGGFVEILNSNLHNNTDNAFEANDGNLTVINNNFYNNGWSAGMINGKVHFTNSQNEASGNRINAFDIFGIDHDQILSDDLPYTGLSVKTGAKVTLEPGVVIKMYGQIIVEGELVARGTADLPAGEAGKKIYFTSLKDDSVGGDTNNDGSASTPIPGDWVRINFLPGSVGNFSNVVFNYAGGFWSWTQTGAAIFNEGGIVSVTDSQIINTFRNGIIQYSGSMNITHSEIAYSAIEGIINFGGALSISQSSIHDNPDYGIHNYDPSPVDARSNWWGDVSGPYHPTLNPSGNVGSSVSNNVDFAPWLGEDPLAVPTPPPPPQFEECCSSVLFLPGLEASRLYLNGGRLWEPTLIHANNTEKLFLNPDGTPQVTGIYTSDVIDESYGANIYKSFASAMDQMVADGKINGWKPYPYDWRRDINDIVEHATLFNDTAVLLAEELENLASHSQTGKVTIITHSNGGLVAKMLINKLVAEGKADLVDKLIMVAAPQLGTPKAVTSMLHGEGLPTDSLPFMMKASTARTLAENMPSAYTLLPSNEYFLRILDPVVEFDPLSTLTQPFINNYGLAITNNTELRGFLLGVDGRTKPTSSDTLTPNILNAPLLARGAEDHIALDSWQSPPGIETIQIVGWGIPTLRGIKYFDKHKFNCLFDCTFLDHEPIMTVDGDETVVVPSAEATDAQIYYLNLKALNKDESFLSLNFFSKNHGDILEAQSLLSSIKEIIQGGTITSQYITPSKPILDPLSDAPTLRLKVHSPVSLDIYDSFGRHTGISTSTLFFPDNLIDEQIPNSYYMEMGEGKYAGADIFGTTTIQLNGEASGVFTLDIEKTAGDMVIATTTFADIPVTENSLASLTIPQTEDIPLSLTLDIDGDGVSDANIAPGDGLSAEELIGILRGFVKNLHLPVKKETQLIKRIDKLEKILEKEFKNDMKKKNKTKKAIENILRSIKTFEKKKLLTNDEASELISIIGKIQGAVVE